MRQLGKVQRKNELELLLYAKTCPTFIVAVFWPVLVLYVLYGHLLDITTSFFRITQGNAIVVYWVSGSPFHRLRRDKEEGGRSDDVSYILAKTITRAIFLSWVMWACIPYIVLPYSHHCSG